MSETGKRAVVTGAASGIGQAVALRLRQEGVAVVAVDMNEAGSARPSPPAQPRSSET